MEQILLFAVLGLGSGALIAGLSLSLVATYRGSGTINIATGGVAMLGAYVFYGLHTGGYLLVPAFYIAGGPNRVVPTSLSIVYTLIICALVGLGMHYLVLRPLRKQAALAKLVASVGVLIIIEAYVVIVFGTQGLVAPDVLGSSPISLLGGTVPSNRIVLLGIVIVLIAGLAVIYRYSRFGLATRAAQESEAEAALSGLSAGRLALINTVAASVIAGGLGIFVAPLTQLDPNTIALAVVPALGAALLAKFTSFTIAGAAGIGMGVLASLVTYAQSQPWFPTTDGLPWPGITELLYFLVIVAALLWRGQSLPDRGTLVEPRLPSAPAPKPLLRPASVWGGICLVLLFVLPYDLRQALIITLIGAIACLSLVLLTGLVGQVSLFQYGLAGVAGLIVSKLSVGAGLGWPWSPIIGILGAAVLGLLMALPALRVRGVQLAILTLAGAVALNTFGLQNPVFGAPSSGAPVPEPTAFGFDIGATSPVKGLDGALPSPLFGVCCLLLLILASFLFANIRRGNLGKRMLAVRSNERAAAGVGVSPARIKMITVVIASIIMAIAGVLYSYNFQAMDSGRFSITNALTLVAFAYLGGITTIRGAITGGLMITQGFFSYILNHFFGISTTIQLVLAGILLIVTIIQNPDGIALAPTPKWPRKLWRKVTGAKESPTSPALTPPAEAGATRPVVSTAAGTGAAQTTVNKVSGTTL